MRVASTVLPLCNYPGPDERALPPYELSGRRRVAGALSVDNHGGNIRTVIFLNLFRLILRLRHGAIVERLVEYVFVDPALAGDLAQRPAARRRFFDDLARRVVADVRIERGGRRERE